MFIRQKLHRKMRIVGEIDGFLWWLVFFQCRLLWKECDIEIKMRKMQNWNRNKWIHPSLHAYSSCNRITSGPSQWHQSSNFTSTCSVSELGVCRECKGCNAFPVSWQTLKLEIKPQQPLNWYPLIPSHCFQREGGRSRRWKGRRGRRLNPGKDGRVQATVNESPKGHWMRWKSQLWFPHSSALHP